MTQCDRILRHLKDHGTINPMHAMQEYGIMRLAARISDLRNAGHKIAKSNVKSVNRYGEAVFYAMYELIEGGEKQ